MRAPILEVITPPPPVVDLPVTKPIVDVGISKPEPTIELLPIVVGPRA